MSERVEVTPLPSSRSFIPGLDGIRALCVITIFIYHSQILPFIPGPLATTTFFFLSGFLITTLFVKEFRKTGRISLSGFYKRRFLRTVPPLLLAMLFILGAAILLKIGGPFIGWKAGGSFLSYTNYAVAVTGSSEGLMPGTLHLWSLAVDEHYYLLFAPLFAFLAVRFRMKFIVGFLLFTCFAFLAWRTWLIYKNGWEVSYWHTMASDTRMDSILWGSILALWRNPALDPEKAKSLLKPHWLVLGAVGIIFVMACRNWTILATVGYTVFGISLIPIFALVVTHGGKGWLSFLHNPSLLWISRASYPLYLLQWIMIDIATKYVPGPRVLGIAVAAVMTLAAGAAMHYWLEVPLAVLRKKSKSDRKVGGPVPSPLQPAEA